MRHNMDVLSETYLKYSPKSIETLIGKKGKNQKSFREVDLELQTKYAIEDADITLQLKHIFDPSIKAISAEKLVTDLEFPLVGVLAEMEMNGIQIDSETLFKMSTELEIELKKLEGKIYEEAGASFNINSPKQLGDILFDVLKIACINPITHYRLEVGQLRTGDVADFILVKDLKKFEVARTFINGELVAEEGKTLIPSVRSAIINNFNVSAKAAADFRLKGDGNEARVIEALDGQLITPEIIEEIKVEGGMVASNPEKDILKIAVVNRYQDTKPAVAFVKNFGLKVGAIASSVAHDSHNIIVVGVDDLSIAKAVNLLIETKGGIAAVAEGMEKVLPLPVAGIMSADDGYLVAKQYTEIDRMAKEMGSALQSPFMTLSFMALLVIPDLKLSDKGLFDGRNFKFVDLFLHQPG